LSVPKSKVIYVSSSNGLAQEFYEKDLKKILDGNAFIQLGEKKDFDYDTDYSITREIIQAYNIYTERK